METLTERILVKLRNPALIRDGDGYFLEAERKLPLMLKLCREDTENIFDLLQNLEANGLIDLRLRAGQNYYDVRLKPGSGFFQKELAA